VVFSRGDETVLSSCLEVGCTCRTLMRAFSCLDVGIEWCKKSGYLNGKNSQLATHTWVADAWAHIVST
jgi:hypothetical protein